MRYFVIIGDIIHSRKASNRYELQKSFAATLREAQVVYGEKITSPLTLTIGDEFQAVLTDADRLFDMLYEIEMKISPATLRFGLGIGQIDTDINIEHSIGMDGPAFHLARNSVEQARKEDRRYHLMYADKTIEQRLNTLLDWIDVSTQRWATEKKKVLYYYRQKYTQQKIAKITSMTQPAVSQNINSTFFKLVHNTQNLIQSEINDLLKE